MLVLLQGRLVVPAHEVQVCDLPEPEWREGIALEASLSRHQPVIEAPDVREQVREAEVTPAAARVERDRASKLRLGPYPVPVGNGHDPGDRDVPVGALRVES